MFMLLLLASLERLSTRAAWRSSFHEATGTKRSPKQVVENLLRGRSATLPLAQKFNVPRVRLAFSLACALHTGLLMTIFNNLQTPAF
jgi:hypothetical protein